jgi:hypothetical protein
MEDRTPLAAFGRLGPTLLMTANARRYLHGA